MFACVRSSYDLCARAHAHSLEGTLVQTYCPPSSHPGIERVQEMVILGVTISDRIGFGAHMDKICCKARKSMFALCVLVTHGYHGERLFAIVRATILARLRYASSVW